MRLNNSLPDLHGDHHNRRPETHASQLQHHLQSFHFDPPSFSHDDFLDQMLSTNIPSSWELPPSASAGVPNGHTELADFSDDAPQPSPSSNPDSVAFQTTFDESSSANLASKLCGYQIGQTTQAAKMAMALLQQQLLMSRGITTATTAADSKLLPLPGSCNGVVEGSSSFNCPNPIGDGSVPSLYNEFAGYLNASGSSHNQNQQLHQPQGSSQKHNFGASITVNNPPPSSVLAGPGSGGASSAQPRQRVRARRGQATDPHSIAERLRRERIAERMKALQELVPNANKTDKASMLDEIIDYVKFLQLQVKVLSMSRLGGATAAKPSFVADISSDEGGTDCNRSKGTGGAAGAPSSNDAMTVTEQQVVKLMEEDMGSAMQYLQGKGLCLMPISLATAISTATCHSRPITASKGGAEGPTSPSMSALTVQSTTLGNGTMDRAVKDTASVSRP